MATNPSIRRAQLYDDYYHRIRGTVTHLFIYKPSSYWDEWQSLCGRLPYERGKSLKDNDHLRLCVDCQARLNLLNDLAADCV